MAKTNIKQVRTFASICEINAMSTTQGQQYQGFRVGYEQQSSHNNYTTMRNMDANAVTSLQNNEGLLPQEKKTPAKQ